MISCVLLATDGLPGAEGALRTARLLAERDGARVEVLAVYDPPIKLYGAQAAAIVAGSPPPFTSAALEELRRKVGAQLAGVGGAASEWPITVKLGAVAPTIARFATDCDASLIVLGLTPHPAVERWLGRETPLRVIHLSAVPVLAVPAHASSLPKRALAAVDLSDLSLRAVRSLPDLVAPGGELHLVHSTWAPPTSEGWATMDWVKTYRDDVEGQVEELAAELRRSTSLEVHLHVPESGDPGREILRLAEKVGAELIAGGSHGHGFLGRIVLGSVSSAILHGARCAVLIAPPTDVPAELSPDRPRDAVIAPFGT
jgi:nucleotide-binding universal stress UspA family protein